MKSILSNKKVIILSSIGIVLVTLITIFLLTRPINLIKNNEELFIPELIDTTVDTNYTITADKTNFSFVEGYSSNALSYNKQGYLGKTFLFKRGTTFNPTLTNNLDELTTIHWHGLEVNGANDGAADPMAVVAPGESKQYTLAVDQPASTIWYHPHAMGTTFNQAYEGLAGMVIVEDSISDSLNIPKEYGINDIPVVLQAKRIDKNGNQSYNGGMFMETDDLFVDGNNPLRHTSHMFDVFTNGHYIPYKDVRNEVIRLRILNGSTHGLMNLTTDTNDSLNIIASDVGFLETTQEKSNFNIAAGERYEVLIDLSNKKPGDIVNIKSGNQEVLTLRVKEDISEATSSKINTIINNLTTIDMYEEYTNQSVDQNYILDDEQINNKSFNMNVINETFTKDQVYYFYIKNDEDEAHSFHIHNARFLIVEKNGQKVDPKEYGFKDTIHLMGGDSYKIQIVFKHTGLFMYHCHILIHEEEGMMGKFEVIE